MTCLSTDYNSQEEIRQHNKAANQMREIVVNAQKEGEQSLAELIQLLDDPTANKWLAFQLLELCELQETDTKRCLAIIRRLATGSSTDVMGAELWLQAWAKNHRT